METLLTLLQWLVPSGGVGALLVWLTSRTLRQTREAKEVHDVYKSMYEDVQATIKALQYDNNNMQMALGALRRTVLRSLSCRYYRVCPLRSELPTISTGLPRADEYANDSPRRGQHHPRDSDADEQENPTGHGADGSLSDEPP